MINKIYSDEIINPVREELKAASDPLLIKSGKRYFREEVTLYGIRSAVVKEISSKHFRRLPDKRKVIVYPACEEFWKSGIMEESFVACHWSYAVKKQYEPEDFEIFEKWVNSYVDNWASCDTLCNHTVGTLVERFPELITRLKSWTASGNRWVKRASAVSLIVPARNGLFLKDIFDIADSLISDRDDMVQKGYGWMLKAASQANCSEVFDYVVARKDRMPRTAYRYAIEKMTPELRAKAMEK